jgi:hypothetical protein
VPRRAAADAAAVWREQTEDERAQLEQDCALARLRPDDWPFLAPAAAAAAWRAAARIVRRLEATGSAPVVAYPEAGRRLAIPWRTVQCWLSRVPSDAIRARARARADSG